MKLTTPAITLLLTALTLATPTPDALTMDWVNSGKCASKNMSINKAIDAFCANSGIVVPSSYAKAGKMVGGYLVSIPSGQMVDNGRCAGVSQWVPAEWCRAQFHAICAASPGGLGAKNYGTGDCQHFQIRKVVKKGSGKGEGYGNGH